MKLKYKGLEERGKEIATSAESRKWLYDCDIEKATMAYLTTFDLGADQRRDSPNLSCRRRHFASRLWRLRSCARTRPEKDHPCRA